MFDGAIRLLEYIGTAITAVAVVRGIGRLVARNSSGSLELPTNRASVSTVCRLARHLLRNERVVVIVFLLSAAGLVAKYLADWTGPPGSFLEVINMLCVVNFWIHYRTTDLAA